jgi:hypothetical protein
MTLPISKPRMGTVQVQVQVPAVAHRAYGLGTRQASLEYGQSSVRLNPVRSTVPTKPLQNVVNRLPNRRTQYQRAPDPDCGSTLLFS